MRRRLPIILTVLLAACARSEQTPVRVTPSQPTLVSSNDTSTQQVVEVGSPAEETASVNVPASLFPDDLPTLGFEVELMYDERWMRVRQTVSLQNTSNDTWQNAAFNAPINAEENAFFLDFANQGEAELDVVGAAPSGQSTVRVALVQPVAPGDTLEVELRYRIVLPAVASTSWPPLGNTGWTAEIIHAGEWYPSPVPYIEGQGWQTVEYRAVGDPTVYPATDATLTVITDPGVVIASGGPIGTEDRDGKVAWQYAVYGARGIGFYASERYEVLETEINGITVYSYYLPEHAAAGQAALDGAVQSIELFTELYGPYPYESLTVAENGFFGGMEYSAMISVTDFAYNTYQGQPNSLLLALVSHEVAHQWWYGAVGNNQALEPWLDEALAFYSEQVFFENYYPVTVDWWWYTRVTRFETYGPVDATIYDYAESSDFIISVYGQAAYFMRDLRDALGDEAFYSFLQAYYLAYAGEIVTGDDFFTMLSEYANDDVRSIIDAYFERDTL